MSGRSAEFRSGVYPAPPSSRFRTQTFLSPLHLSFLRFTAVVRVHGRPVCLFRWKPRARSGLDHVRTWRQRLQGRDEPCERWESEEACCCLDPGKPFEKENIQPGLATSSLPSRLPSSGPFLLDPFHPKIGTPSQASPYSEPSQLTAATPLIASSRCPGRWSEPTPGVGGLGSLGVPRRPWSVNQSPAGEAVGD